MEQGLSALELHVSPGTLSQSHPYICLFQPLPAHRHMQLAGEPVAVLF